MEPCLDSDEVNVVEEEEGEDEEEEEDNCVTMSSRCSKFQWVGGEERGEGEEEEEEEEEVAEEPDWPERHLLNLPPPRYFTRQVAHFSG